MWKKILPIVVIPVVLMLWSGLGAPALLSTSYKSATQYAGVYRTNGAPGAAGEPIVEQVVIIVVDGLRVDESRRLPELNRLRAIGSQRVLQVGQPSLSFPGWTAICTGAWPEQSGISSNDIDRTIELDTIFAGARKGGMDTAIVGSVGWRTLFDPAQVELNVLYEPPKYDSLDDILAFDERLARAGRKVLLREPQLVLIHLLGVDTAGHGFGGVSSEYSQAAVAADRLIASLIKLIDLSRAAVFVTADHGHIDGGGHGGREAVVRRVPLVAAGKGIKPGVYAEGKQVDIAPTVAVMLGMAIPGHNQGDVLLDQMEVPPSVSASSAVYVAEQLSNRYRTMLHVIGSPAEIGQGSLERAQDALTSGDYAQAEKLARETGRQARVQWQAQRGERLMRERLMRAPTSALLLLPFVLYGIWWRRVGWGFSTPILAALTFFGWWHALFWARGFSYSVSWFNIDPVVFVQPRVVDAVTGLILVILIVGAVCRRVSNLDVALTSVHTLLLIGAGMVVQIVAFYLAWDVRYYWYLPDLAAGAKYYLDVTVSTVFWPYPALPLAVFLPILALMVARFGGVLERRTRGG